MAHKFSFSIFMILILSGCSQSSTNNKIYKVTDTSKEDINNVSKKNPIIKSNPESITTNHILFPGSDTLFSKMHINGVKDVKVLPVNITSGKFLYATIIPDEQQANLRINQLQMPDSSFDGPFGRDLDYKIKIAGTYKLIIGESLMAEGNWKGNFMVKVWVK